MAQTHEGSLRFFCLLKKKNKHLFGCVGSQHVGSSSGQAGSFVALHGLCSCCAWVPEHTGSVAVMLRLICSIAFEILVP